MHYLALTFKRVYEFLILFPRWVLMIASGAVANLVMKAMHSSAGTDRPQPRAAGQEPAQEPAPAPAPTPAANEKTTETKASPAKSKGKRRNAKK